MRIATNLSIVKFVRKEIRMKDYISYRKHAI